MKGLNKCAQEIHKKSWIHNISDIFRAEILQNGILELISFILCIYFLVLFF